MNLILHLLLDAAVIFGLAYIMPQVQVKSFGTALLIAVLLGLLNFFIGWIIRFPLNLITFFLLTGIIRIVVTAILLKLIDSFMDSFTIDGFWPALVIALAVAVAGTLIDRSAPTKERIESGYEALANVSTVSLT
ncbi:MULTISPECIES: phage holin family protein [Spirosoma]|uniref:Phage holin family protein n=1 Tax=Spirosoma liriopis TaxID=2937440 RepID=A0ABT0HGD6_9BACT|nr:MULTISPECIES: phage holin family protein [Spirosoma]MCK8491211.1 phage holin family protein [Spirosoma liriopis]UHG90588.1 phage holin family protein [Spirosoma oryzicola]